MASVAVSQLQYRNALESRAFRILSRIPYANQLQSRPVGLSEVTFVAPPSSITAVMSLEDTERKLVLKMIGCPPSTGEYDGQVYFSDGYTMSDVGYVSTDSENLYTPGLSYIEMLSYAARLRLAAARRVGAPPVDLAERVQRVLDVMDLQGCCDKIIHERPCLRGIEGGEIRRLSIAIEILLLPQIIVLEEPTAGLDTQEALRVMSRLQILADSGHTVVCSLARPPPPIFDLLDEIVVVGEGRSIYSGPTAKLVSYFSSEPLNYSVDNTSHLPDFLSDLCSGIERPKGYRAALTMRGLQELFAESEHWRGIKNTMTDIQNRLPHSYNDKPLDSTSRNLEEGTTAHTIAVLAEQSGDSWSLYMSAVFSRYNDPWVFVPASWELFCTVFSRSINVKLREKEVIVKNLVTLVLTAVITGGLAYGTGDYGIYCLNLLRMPYAETFDMIAILFLLTSVLFSIQILNIHIVCQKLQIFRYERNKKCCSLFSFWLATILAECAFGLVYFLIYSSIIYFMTRMAAGYSKFLFFVSLHGTVTVVAVATALAFAAFFRTEFIVRDMYLIWFFLMVMFSGYPVHIPYFFNWAQKMSILNPLKWAYQGTFVWKFENYVDHDGLLTTYGFNNFDKYDTFPILLRYIAVSLSIFTLCLLPPLTLLRRRGAGDKESGLDAALLDGVPSEAQNGHTTNADLSSMNENGFRSPSSRGVAPVVPVVFHRNTSISHTKSNTGVSGNSLTGVVKNALSAQVEMSKNSGEAENGVLQMNGHTQRGPTIVFEDLSYTVGGASKLQSKTVGRISRAFKSVKSTVDNVATRFFSVMKGEGLESDNRRNTYSLSVAMGRETFSTKSGEKSSEKKILKGISGRCDWGKLTFVMGQKDSGKSTLLHLLGGGSPDGGEISGSVKHDDVQCSHQPTSLLREGDKAWRRGGYVCATDEHYGTLTVAETIGYALRLRSTVALGVNDVKAVVEKILTLLHLTEYADTYVSELNRGMTRLLSVCEELTSDPYLLLIDEPISGLSTRESSLLMGAMRELVNQDRTVIATVYQAPANVFELFDTLILLSHGSIIYCGPAEHAVPYFMSYPEYRIITAKSSSTTQQNTPAGAEAAAENPVDFLLRVSFDTKAVDLLKNSGSYVYDTETRTMSKSSQNGVSGGYIAYLSAQDPSFVAAAVEGTGTKKSDTLKKGGMSSADILMFLKVFLIHGWVIFERSFFVLFNGWYLCLAALFMHTCFAFIFPVTMGDCSDDEYAIMAFFGYGSMLLIVVGVLFAPFLMTTREVFLKECSRGLYGPVMYWCFGSVHYTFFRCVLGVYFGSLAYYFLNLRTITEEFYLLALVMHTVVASTISEVLVYNSADLRTAYTVLPGFAFLLFLTSSLMIKPSTYPEFFQSWLPSVSIVRWTMQAMTINEFSDGENMGSVANFDVYTELMRLFGWGGKSKWLCLYYMCYNALVYRVLVFYILAKKIMKESGMRRHRVVKEDEVNLYY